MGGVCAILDLLGLAEMQVKQTANKEDPSGASRGLLPPGPRAAGGPDLGGGPPQPALRREMTAGAMLDLPPEGQRCQAVLGFP